MVDRTRSILPGQVRLRPIHGRPHLPRNASGSSTPVLWHSWIEIPVPTIVNPGVFGMVQAQPGQNRRKCEGERRPGWLL
jgi:hypothetical protein